MQAKTNTHERGERIESTLLEIGLRDIEMNSEYKAEVMPGLPSSQNLTAEKGERQGCIKPDVADEHNISMMDYQELERKRISRELHDGLGQLLTSIKLRVQQCVSELESSGKVDDLGDSWGPMEQIPGMVTEAIQEVRNICSALRPAMLDDLGVLPSINWQCRQCRETMPRLKTEVDFFVEESDIPQTFKTNLYRIVQEALNNAIKYSSADVIRVHLRKEQGTLYLNIEDNGKGFSLDSAGVRFTSTGIGGLGLTSMLERAESLGGTLIIESNENIGTNVQVALPLPTESLQFSN